MHYNPHIVSSSGMPPRITSPFFPYTLHSHFMSCSCVLYILGTSPFIVVISSSLFSVTQSRSNNPNSILSTHRAGIYASDILWRDLFRHNERVFRAGMGHFTISNRKELAQVRGEAVRSSPSFWNGPTDWSIAQDLTDWTIRNTAI
jgi:hypothetical protein